MPDVKVNLTQKEQAKRWELWEVMQNLKAMANRSQRHRVIMAALGLETEFRELYGDRVPNRVVLR